MRFMNHHNETFKPNAQMCKMMIRNFANPNNICETCNRHYSIQIKTQSYIMFPGLIELKHHTTHRWCGVFKYNRENAQRNKSTQKIDPFFVK